MTSSTILDTNIDIRYREEHEQKKVGEDQIKISEIEEKRERK